MGVFSYCLWKLNYSYRLDDLVEVDWVRREGWDGMVENIIYLRYLEDERFMKLIGK